MLTSLDKYFSADFLNGCLSSLSSTRSCIATRLRSGGIFNYSITRNLLLSPSVKPHHNHNRFTALFSRTTRVSRCQKRTSGLYSTREDWQTPTIRLGATASGLTSAHLHHPHFYRPDALPAA